MLFNVSFRYKIKNRYIQYISIIELLNINVPYLAKSKNNSSSSEQNIIYFFFIKQNNICTLSDFRKQILQIIQLLYKKDKKIFFFI